ncbi:unnamed protein product [Symbiodinium sp. CCMP2592]|nr:unnamed protein product [Symbiodinium sp. CCMP2592]
MWPSPFTRPTHGSTRRAASRAFLLAVPLPWVLAPVTKQRSWRHWRARKRSFPRRRMPWILTLASSADVTEGFGEVKMWGWARRAKWPRPRWRQLKSL